MIPAYPSKIKLLKKTAVPSMNLPTDTPKTLEKKERASIRSSRLESRNKRKLESNKTEDVGLLAQNTDTGLDENKKIRLDEFIRRYTPLKDDLNSSSNGTVVSSNKKVDKTNDSQQKKNSEPEKVDKVPSEPYIYVYDPSKFTNYEAADEVIADLETSAYNRVVISLNKSVQVGSDNYTNFIKNDKDLIVMTGLRSFDLLDLLQDVVRCAIPAIDLYLCKNSVQLSIKDRIVLTFMKLKLNFDYSILSVFFRLNCECTCRNTFLRMLDILSASLQFAIYWPDKQDVTKNLPTCFEDFPDVRAVVDIIEINIQKPNKECCQTDSYSLQKSTDTVKFMTAVSPGGLVSFISEAYPGGASDKAIFENSKIIEKLEQTDNLIADKSFLIDDICTQHGIKVVRLPPCKRKKNLSKEENVTRSKIAKARSYTNRTHQLVKMFRMLNTAVPSYLVSKMDQIFLIVCAIINLSEPFSKNKEVAAE